MVENEFRLPRIWWQISSASRDEINKKKIKKREERKNPVQTDGVRRRRRRTGRTKHCWDYHER